MVDPHAALDWLARRHAGESAAYIAAHAGVSEDTVLRATRDYGPFPRPSTQVRRSYVHDALLGERARGWVELRRRGHTTVDIAKAHGVSRQYVGAVTAGHGPYPDPRVVQRWVALRRAGRSLASIADAEGATVGLVRSQTAPFGPFRPVGNRLPPGLVGLAEVARITGLSPLTVRRWRRSGLLPEPEFLTAAGRWLWFEATLSTWGENLKLEACPTCGARALSLRRHRNAAGH